MVDRWQSRYLGSIVGLDSLTSRKDESDTKCAPFSPMNKRATSLYKDISSPLSNLLDHRRSKLRELKSKDFFTLPSSEQVAPVKAEKACKECNKKLSGKLARIPNTQERYHWSCLKCEGYNSALHLKCFRCTGCQKVLQPSSIYTDIQGYFCQQCTNDRLPDNQEQLSKHMKIVPQPQAVFPTQPSIILDNNSLLCEDNMSDTSSISSESDIADAYASMSISTPTSRCSYSTPAHRKVAPKNDIVKPSLLMSSRGRPLPRFGVVRDCPRCNERITSVHDEIPGPKASRWHKKCLKIKQLENYILGVQLV
ncbi:hypothetical protein G6F60_001564 [Rhizopus arrhizus]|nr:hypothetical protein G6F61_001332 [Rhizopus arrhizus]KAG1408302.1 hypothetical protein G6F60_001564 [Rhizopus arrhizus]